LIIAFQYGYHISALNQIQAVLTCKVSSTSCIPMTDSTFSLVTSIFTVGGLAGSLFANLIMDKWGRRGAHRICAILMASGTAFMGLSTSVSPLLIGRFLIGVASGLGICVGPIYLAEIAPSNISGTVGVLTQIAIVLGIMFTQVAGITLATPSTWRFVFLISFIISVLQFLFSSVIVESPTWLFNQSLMDEHKRAVTKIWNNVVSEEPLLNQFEENRKVSTQESLTIPQVFATTGLRKPLMIVSLVMLSQQMAGINAVLYYSNDILAKSLPHFGPYISFGITVINMIMTFPPIILIERLGTARLLKISVLGSLVSLFAVGWGLNSGGSVVPSVAIVSFVMFFAVGLGPLPFCMIPEVSPPYAVSSLASVALSVHWITNFCVGLVFLPMRNFLSGGDMFKEGRVFYIFVAMLSLSTLFLFQKYRLHMLSHHWRLWLFRSIG